MKVVSAAQIALLPLATICGLAADDASCPPLSENTAQRISRYVQAKYQVPFALDVKATDISLVENTCFRKMRFSAHAAPEFGMVLYLSPDQRYLSRELWDSTMDPTREKIESEHSTEQVLLSTKAPAIGRPDSSITIIVFSDFQCPFCREEARVLQEDVLPHEPDVRVIFRNLPLAIHDWSQLAALGGACAALQGDGPFWQLHDFLFRQQPQLSATSVVPAMESFLEEKKILDLDDFRECLRGRQSAQLVESDISLARTTETYSVPTLFVNGRRVNGAAPAEQLRTIIHQIRRSPQTVQPPARRGAPSS